MPKKTAVRKPAAETPSPLQIARLAREKNDAAIESVVRRCKLVLNAPTAILAKLANARQPFQSEDDPIEGITRDHWREAILVLHGVLKKTGRKPIYDIRSWTSPDEAAYMQSLTAIVIDAGSVTSLDRSVKDIATEAKYGKHIVRRLVSESLFNAATFMRAFETTRAVKEHFTEPLAELDRLLLEADQRNLLPDHEPPIQDVILHILKSAKAEAEVKATPPIDAPSLKQAVDAVSPSQPVTVLQVQERIATDLTRLQPQLIRFLLDHRFTDNGQPRRYSGEELAMKSGIKSAVKMVKTIRKLNEFWAFVIHTAGDEQTGYGLQNVVD
jgi:hypothetical protein